MTRAQAQAAVDDAFKDAISRVFGVLVGNLEGGDPDSTKKFLTVLDIHARAHEIASAAVAVRFQEVAS